MVTGAYRQGRGLVLKLLDLFPQNLFSLTVFFILVVLNLGRFLASGKESKFKEINERLSNSKAQQEEEEKKKAEVLEELKKNKEYMADHGSVMRNIDDNLKYRKTVKEVEELQKEIEALEEQMVATGEASSLEIELRRTAGIIQNLLSQVSVSSQTQMEPSPEAKSNNR